MLSAHDFDGMPDDLDARVRSLLSQGTEVVKLAVQTRKLSDCVTTARHRFTLERATTSS